MRTFILIAGFALISVAAQAGDRSLSLGGGETTKVSAPAKATEGPRTAEVPQAAEAPKYVERPAAVETKPETTRSETVKTETTGTETRNTGKARHRPAGMQQRYAGRPASAGPGSPSARRAAMMQQRGAGRYRMRYSIRARIIAALHRHGIYW